VRRACLRDLTLKLRAAVRAFELSPEVELGHRIRRQQA
jgi:hypothetical protein